MDFTKCEAVTRGKLSIFILFSNFLTLKQQQKQADAEHRPVDGPKGIRIPVSDLRGQRPRPLDDGAEPEKILPGTAVLSTALPVLAQLAAERVAGEVGQHAALPLGEALIAEIV